MTNTLSDHAVEISLDQLQLIHMLEDQLCLALAKLSHVKNVPDQVWSDMEDLYQTLDELRDHAMFAPMGIRACTETA